MSFFDEGDKPRTAVRTSSPRPRRTPPATRRAVDDRTLLFRRGGAALAAVLVIVAIVFAVKTVLDHQATAALKDYATRVATMVGDEQSNVRVPFFRQIDLAGNSTNQTTIADNIQQEVQQEQTYYHDAESWSVPSQMVGAQRQYVQALGLRYEALQTVAAKIGGALGTGDQTTALKEIAGAMELFLASDVIYAERVQPLITQELATAGISGQTVPASEFLPDVRWTVPQTTATFILGYVPSGLGGVTTPGSAGHELVGVTWGSANTALSSTSVNTLPLSSSGITFNLQVKNSGTVAVHGVVTEVRFRSASVSTSCLLTKNTIPLTQVGGTYLSPIVVSPPSGCGPFFNIPLEMTAEVVPLSGETDKTNNYLRFLVEFTNG